MRVLFKKSRFRPATFQDLRLFNKPRSSSLHKAAKKVPGSTNLNASRPNLRNSSLEGYIYCTDIENCETFVLRDINMPKNLHEGELILD